MATHKNEDIYWLAGLLEGEGYFGIQGNKPIIRLSMTDLDIVERANSILGNNSIHTYQRKENWKPTHIIQFGGKPALDWMIRLYPYLGERRRGKIDEVRELYDPSLSQKATTKRRALTDEQERKVLEKFNNGMTIRSLANEYSVHWRTIMRAKKRASTHASIAKRPKATAS